MHKDNINSSKALDFNKTNINILFVNRELWKWARVGVLQNFTENYDSENVFVKLLDLKVLQGTQVNEKHSIYKSLS